MAVCGQPGTNFSNSQELVPPAPGVGDAQRNACRPEEDLSRLPQCLSSDPI